MPVEPPLLRWAAGHLLRRERSTVAGLHDRAAPLDSRHGPAVLAGALDAADSLNRPDLLAATARGLTSGRAPVRKVALQVLADRSTPPRPLAWTTTIRTRRSAAGRPPWTP